MPAGLVNRLLIIFANTIMPKGHKRMKRHRGRKSNKPRFTDSGVTTVSFSGQLSFNFNTNSGIGFQEIYPTSTFCPRFYNVSTNFEYYRIIAFEYFLVPSTTHVSNEMFGHALLPSDANTLLPSTFGDLLQQPAAKIYDARMVTLQKNKLTRKALLQQPTKWWTCREQAGTEDDYVQAKFTIISSNGLVDNTIMWYFKFVVEFRSAAINNIGLSLKEEEEEPKHVKGCQCTKCLKNS